jgi:hypothetical protein
MSSKLAEWLKWQSACLASVEALSSNSSTSKSTRKKKKNKRKSKEMQNWLGVVVHICNSGEGGKRNMVRLAWAKA